VQLEVNDCSGWRFPKRVWQYIFHTGCKLPHLTQLQLLDDDADWFDVPHKSMCSPSWCATDLSRLVSSCPSLCDVSILPLQLGPHVSELRKLTALTRLGLFHDSHGGGSPDEDGRFDFDGFDKSVRGVATITQLRHLKVKHVSQHIKLGSLLPLTSLTALTEMLVCWVPDKRSEIGSDDEDDEDGPWLCLHDEKVSQSSIVRRVEASPF
jgi:hypothetical protein